MLAAGRPWICWIYHTSIILALAGRTLGDGIAPLSAQDSGPPADPATAWATACPARSTWEVEGELFQLPICLESRWGRGRDGQHAASISPGVSGVGNDTSGADAAAVSSGMSEGAASATAAQDAEQEQDADSLLDGASFLSFEEWKKQNLAKVGQSAENVGGSRRSAAAGKEDRRQPTGISNALDSLGDDAEIELDFGGFGAESPEASPTAWGTPVPSSDGSDAEDPEGTADVDVYAQGTSQTDVSHRKDAGTTCKERFNYASFDCAATVLKTNPECQGSSSVLIENKDSYMLNECRAQNKFLILELCDDILVDTVVLANYEFFSSIFHTFRVSVADRYPAKPDQWKQLGVYEARNTREVQAFAVENSLIWARYLKVEFLTHYGHEFYCPVSLIRVHGTTMMEEYKHDEGAGRADAELLEPVEAGQLPGDSGAEHVAAPTGESIAGEDHMPSTGAGEACPNPLSEVESLLLRLPHGPPGTCGIDDDGPPRTTRPEGSAATVHTDPSSNANSTTRAGENVPTSPPGFSIPPHAAEDTRKTGESAKPVVATPDSSVVAAESTPQNATSETAGKSTANPKEEQHSASPESTRPTSTQPPSSNPTTQESFFKSVNKRLQMLESNSTLSLLYIEEQSRILRDAFNKVEKRQLAKTSTFLENLNVTVLNELKEFREQYDRVWKSVAFEFEHQRLQYHQEVHSLSAQLGVLADELVFQKRVTVIQSIMVLCCFALVLFSRGSVGHYMEFPGVQRMVARSYSLRSASPIFASPSTSPDSTRPTSSYREDAGHRRNLSDSSSSSVDSTAGPAVVAYAPPTPTSERSRGMDDVDDKANSPSPPAGPSYFRSRSTPAVVNGHTTDLDADAEDPEASSSELPKSAGPRPPA